MSDSPQDAQSLIEWFTATEIVRHDGSRADREPKMTAEEAGMLAAKIGQPSYWGTKEYREANPWSAHEVWNTALNGSLFMGKRFGWIDRDGSFYGCGHASHELLLHFLGIDIRTAEDGGWIRISMSGAQSIFCPSDKQIRTLVLMGLEHAAKNLVYEGLEPTRGAVKAGRIKDNTL